MSKKSYRVEQLNKLIKTANKEIKDWQGFRKKCEKELKLYV